MTLASHICMTQSHNYYLHDRISLSNFMLHTRPRVFPLASFSFPGVFARKADLGIVAAEVFFCYSVHGVRCIALPSAIQVVCRKARRFRYYRLLLPPVIHLSHTRLVCPVRPVAADHRCAVQI